MCHNNIKEGYVINYIKPNWNGSKIAVGVTKDDLEIGEIIVVDVKNKKLFNESIYHCWPSTLGGIRWLADNNSFLYEYIPIINKSSKKYLLNVQTRLHKIGEHPKKDVVIFSKTNNPEFHFKSEDFPEVEIKNENSNYMFASISGPNYYADYYISPLNHLKNKKIKWQPLFKKEDLIKKFYTNKDEIIFLTAKNAANFKICKTSLSNPNFKNPQILIEEDSISVITDFALTDRGMFFVTTKNGVEAKLFQRQLNGDVKVIKIPKRAGYINVSSKGSSYKDLWIEIRGWTYTEERYKYNFEQQQFLKEMLSVVEYKELQNTVIKEVEVTSYDGVKVPLSIIYKKGIKLNGNNRLLMRGYGAFGIPLSPAINNYLLHWVHQGGIYVIAHVRGGGEKGNSWYKGGFKKTKPNSWKDFIACTEYLIKKKYTSPQKIVISSASGGGILIGRAITERPDLFAAALIRVGIFNTLRSEFAPNGKNLSKEFGSVKDSLEFKYLLEMDAYQHIKEGVKYPAVYLTAGMNDSRVVVWQPGKFTAKLQNATSSHKPILLYVDSKGGHGFAASAKKKNKELVNLLSFALWQTGHPDYQLK